MRLSDLRLGAPLFVQCLCVLGIALIGLLDETALLPPSILILRWMVLTFGLVIFLCVVWAVQAYRILHTPRSI